MPIDALSGTQDLSQRVNQNGPQHLITELDVARQNSEKHSCLVFFAV